MLSVLMSGDDGFLPCPRTHSPPIMSDCYSISLKKVISGDVSYGRTKYDFTNGALIFMAPRQVLQWDENVVFEQRGFTINFHEDFIKGTDLFEEIRQYGFFSYAANEALHLSPREEDQIEAIASSIADEYHNNHDQFSKEIILSQLSTLLKYANRFYERQFLNRKGFSNSLMERIDRYMDDYFDRAEPSMEGIPSIEAMARSLGMSQRYLSDTLKKETGRTSKDHLQLYLINRAKHSLLAPDKSIADVAYELGFEYPQYFSRLFKKKEGISPTEYREKFKMN